MLALSPHLYGSVFVMPTIITDKYIKLASPVAIKTLLWILRNQSGNFSIPEMSKAIGESESDINEAIEYWCGEEILFDLESPKKASPLKSDVEYIEKDSLKKPVQSLPEIKLSKPTQTQIIARINEEDDIKMLMNEAQLILGKTIGQDTQSVLLMIYDGYGLKVEIILTLLQYCVGISKASTAYISKLSKVWAEKEINSLEKANAYIEKHSNANILFQKLKPLTGIATPEPTTKQADYLIAWSDLGFSVEVIALAFEETSERTGKISFAYMDKIISNWANSGFKTLSDIEFNKKSFKEQKAIASAKKSSYNIDEASKKSTNEPIKYIKKKDR
ncbi:MAG: DnaD domain protein [Oscillospiraceae bacterium]